MPSNSILAASIELNTSLAAVLVGFSETVASKQQDMARECWLLDGNDGSVIGTPGGYITAALTFGSDGKFYQAAKWDGGDEFRGVWVLDSGGTLVAGPFVSNRLDFADLAFGPAGHLYGSVAGTSVQKFDGTTGALLDAAFITGGTAFKGLEWRDNVLYVVEMGTSAVDGSILRFDTNGVALGAFVAAGAGGLHRPLKFAFTPDGGVLVCDYYIGDGGFVRQYDNSGASMGNFTSFQPAGLDAWGQTNAWPMDVAVEEFTPATPPADNFVAYCTWAHTADSLFDEIWAYDGDGNMVWTNYDQIAGDHAPLAIDYNSKNGLLYVVYWDGLRYQSFDTDGTLVDTSPGLGSRPSDIEIGPDGMIYMCIAGDRGVDRWDPATNTKDADFTSDTNASAIAWGPDGHLYVRLGSTTVAKYDGTTGALLDGSFITSGLTAGSRMKWYNGDLYIADMNATPNGTLADGIIRRFDSNGVYQADFVLAGAGGLMNPEGFDFTPDGGLIVGDYWGSEAGPMAFRRYDSNGNSLGDFEQSGPAGAWGPNGWAQDVVIRSFPPPRATLLILE